MNLLRSFVPMWGAVLMNDAILAGLRWWLTKEIDLDITILQRNIKRGEEASHYTSEETEEMREKLLGWRARIEEITQIRDSMWED